MSCERPLVAVRCRFPNPNSIRILRRVDEACNLEEKYGRNNVLFLPCGECASCKLKYRSNWAVRCEMEGLMHEDNCFLTITYDNQHLPDAPSKRDIKKFLKGLWNKKIQFSYFLCGERGTQTYRSHYHVILFGYKPDDLKYYGDSKSGIPMFSSKTLDEVWKKGFVRVQEFDHKCGSYVAGYVKKKEDQDNFLMMSKGLGFDYMNANVAKLFRYQNYVGLNGRVHQLPRYFERICELNGYDLIEVKRKQKDTMFKQIDSSLIDSNLSHNVELFGRDAALMRDKLHRLKRGL